MFHAGFGGDLITERPPQGRFSVTTRRAPPRCVLFQNEDAPFDREAGEVLIACQKHFRALPPNIVVGVCTRDESGHESLAAYTIPHVFV
jgi:hypothetical protein